MIIRHHLYTVILFLLCYLPLHGFGQTRFYTSVSEQRVAQNQTFQVQYTVEGAGEIRDFTLPRFNDFKVEEVFDMHNTVVLGQQNMQPVRSYSKIIVLSPKKKGRFVIDGASASIDGKLLHSNSVTVTVQASNLSAPSSPSVSGIPGMPHFFEEEEIDTENESVLRPGEDVAKKVHKNFFLRIEASKTSCYVGEPIMVVYKAYSRLNANSQVVRRPSFTGFSVQEMVDSYDSKPVIEKLNGIPYYSIIIRKAQLFPLQEGDFTLDAAEIESVVHFIKPDYSGNSMLGGTRYDYNTTLRTDPLTIKVKPLPAEGQPADFSGAVGELSLSIVPPNTSIHRGDLVTIQAIVSGTGNLSLITAPHVNWPRGVDTSEPIVKENVNKYVYPLSGNKTFEYSFAASDTGNIVIPATAFHYFDPAEKRYKTATSEPVTLRVLPGMSKDKEDSLKTAMQTAGNKSTVPLHYYYFGLVVLIIVSLVIYQVVRLRKPKKAIAAPVVTVVSSEPVKETPPPAGDLLMKAGWALEHNDHLLFYREIQDNLWKVAAAKCNVLPSALNKQNIARELLLRNTSPDTVRELSDALQECEWALYTPSADRQNMSILLGKTENLITELQKV